MKQSVRLAIAFFLLSTIPVAFVTLVSTINAEHTIEREVASHLEAVVEMRAGDLDRWMGTLRRTIESIAQRPLVVDLSEELSRQLRGETPFDPTISAQLLDVHLLPHLRAGGTFEELSVVDVKTGQVLASTSPDQVGTFRIGEPYFQGGLSQTFLDRIRFVPALETMALHVSTPIRDEGASPGALLVGRADVRVLDEIIAYGKDAEDTEDVYLINAQGVFVTEPRYGDGFALRHYASSEGALRAISGETGVHGYVGYRGVPVLGAYRWLPEIEMALLAEIDRQVVLSTVGRTRNLSYGLLAGAVILFTFLGASVARQMTHPLRRIAAGVARVGRGEFDHRIGLHRNDEFGDLARAFDQMTENLQRITASRDELQLEVVKRERAEEQLRDSLGALERSESLFRLLSESSPVGICIWQGESLAYLNPALERTLGYGSEELLERSIPAGMVSQEDRALILRYVERVKTGGIPQEPIRFRVIRNDGSFVPCEGYARRVEYRGRPAILGTVIDTSLLRQAEERFRLAALVASDLIYEWDVATDVLTWHADIDAKLGCPPGTIAHTIEAWVSRIHPEDQAGLRGAIERHRTAVEPIFEAYRIRHEDGTWRHWIDRGVPVLDAEGRPVRWIGVCIDETDQVNAYEARVESEQRFRRILENAPDIIYRYQAHPEQGFEYLSGAIEAITGYRPEELLHRSDVNDTLLHPDERDGFGRSLDEAKAQGAPHTHRWLHKDGRTIWIEDVHVQILDESGRLSAVEGVARDITDRIEAERELRTADDIVQSLPTGLLILRREESGRFLIESANPVASEFIAGEGRWIDGRALEEVFPEAMMEGVQSIFTRTLESGVVYDGEVVIPEGEGIRVAMHLRAFTIPGDRLVAAFEDITLQKQAQLDLLESEAQYRELVEEIHDVIFSVDEKGVVTYVSPAIEQLLGFTADELIGRAYSSLQFAEGLPSIDDMRELFGSSRVLRMAEYRLTGKDGKDRWVRTRSRPIFRDGAFSGFRGVLIDITDARRSEEALRISEEKYRSLFENSALGIYQTTPDGRILSANPALVRMLGFSNLDELVSRNLEQDGYEPQTPRSKFREEIESKGQIQGRESVWIRRDGRRLVVRENARAVRDHEGNVILYEGTIEDITAQREAEDEKERLEAKLRQSQKLESIGTLASGVAHEINNPLTGMINYAELISRRVGDPGLRDYAEAIMSEGGRVAKIVRNLLSFARQERETHSPARLADIYDAALSLVGQLLKKDHILVEAHVPADLPTIKCRSQQIQQVLLNLLTNARDALNDRYPRDDDNKTIVIRASSVELEGARWVRLTVEDRGTGIAEENVSRIFDPFFTTKPRDRGTGLGLSISYGIVRDHGGRLTVESAPQEFTRITLELPADNGWKLEHGKEG